ncbi:MAG: insulinase family protein [Acidobacteria bacterium]|nr:insulinase family protein [Acidobacteriota bacterium]
MKRRLLIFTLIVSFVGTLQPGSGAYGQQGPRTASKPEAAAAKANAPAPLPQQMQLANRVLANGLEVIVLEDHSVPLVTIELAVKNGSYTEPPELNGLSHLFEHMFFRTNRADANHEPYLQQLGESGMPQPNGQTQEELVNYYVTSTTQYYPAALRYMKDSIRYPLFDEQEFAREKEVVIGELDRHESNPGFYLNEAMINRLYYKYPSRKNPGGNRETVSKATTAIMRMIQQRYYVPNNTALVVTGDARPEDVFRQAQEMFGDWPRAEDPFVKFPMVEHPPLPKSEGAVIKQPVQNVIINLGWHGPSIGKDDQATYAADVFSYILQQPNSRFQRALVDTGLVTGVSISYYTQRNVGPIQLIAQTTPEKARAALKAIYAEIARFNDKDYYTDEQLESAKAILAGEDLYRREKLSEYVHVISFWWASTGLDYFRGYQDNLRRTSRADISRYVTNYIIGKPHVGLAMMSEEAQKSAALTPEELIGQ